VDVRVPAGLTSRAPVRTIAGVKKRDKVQRPLGGIDYVPDRTRLDMKVPKEIRELIVAAAELSYESLTGFVLHAAVDRARRLVRDLELVRAAEDQLRRLPYVKL